MAPDADFGEQHTAARQYYYRFLDRPEDAVVGVAGSVPARAQQGWLLSVNVPRVEALTLGAIFILVGFAFRSVVVPLIALGASGIAVFATTWLLELASAVMDIGAPAELRPLLIALILGIVTDYTVFYVVGFGAELRKNRASIEEAIVASVGSYTPIIVAAGLTVAAGTAVLLVAEEQFFHAFGPAMALTILVGLLISVTLVPALMSVLGPKVFWPRRDPRLLDRDDESTAVETGSSGLTVWLANAMVRKPAAALALVVCTLLLVAASLPLMNIKLGADFSGALPPDNSVSEANQAAVAGFAPGITSPTTLLIEGDGLNNRQSELIELQRLIEAKPGIAGVIGPSQQLPRIPNLMVSRDGQAARMLVVLDNTPLGARAIADLSDLRADIDGLGAQAGLPGYQFSFTGDSALAEGLVTGTINDLGRIALALFVVNFLLLAIFLRALLAPLFLLLSSVLALTASLGITTYVFMEVLGEEGLTFYVPFAAAVLLVALGSDYNIFGVGRMWELARSMTLPEAIRQAMPETSKAITTAGLALAVSFGMLAVIPVTSFRELAVAMSIGILIDSFLVRSVMMPAMLTLMGRYSAWPNRRLLPHDRLRHAEEQEARKYSNEALKELWRPRR
nr:MMPL family transporter [Kineosphaera limosa]